MLSAKERLPLPAEAIPENPAFPATVITSGGQRLLLEYVTERVHVEYRDGQLTTKPAGWILVNYPLEQISGFTSAEKAASVLFGCSASKLKNYYFYTPGLAEAEPAVPAAPAPIRLHRQFSKRAGNEAELAEALKQARPGDVIRLKYGIYRKPLLFLRGGTRQKPIVLEGEANKNGDLPVISGNMLFPKDAFHPVAGYSGVYRASNPTEYPGRISCDGKNLKETGSLNTLRPGAFFWNRGSRQFAAGFPAEPLSPRKVSAGKGMAWRKVTADSEGMLELGKAPSGGLFYGVVHLYLPPKTRKKGVLFDPRFPLPINGRLKTSGAFRAARQTGSGVGSQSNQYRLRVNGEILDVGFAPGKPRASLNYGKSDTWQDFELKEGWNKLEFMFDTGFKPKDNQFKFGLPAGLKYYIVSAEAPADFREPPPENAVKATFVTEMMVLGPLKTDPDGGYYVFLPDGENPNSHTMEVSRHTSLANVKYPYIHIRGLEFRHGAQFQQRAQVAVTGEGCLIEGCKFVEPEVRALTVGLTGLDQASDPVVLRNNFIYDPGGVGVAASGDSKRLTAENQNKNAPGRGRLIAEFNTVIGNNGSGYERYWESGAFKMFRLTGSVLRWNRFLGGNGPGIWLDWEHYNNRIEGNYAFGVNSFSIGVEASPGPNLICNNLSVNLIPGAVWFRCAILAWSSDRVWAVHNTIDGGNNQTRVWKGMTGTDGIYLTEGGSDRRTAWVPVPKNCAAYNNILTGVFFGVFGKGAGNWADAPAVRKTAAVKTVKFFHDHSKQDYRLTEEAAEKCRGVRNRQVDLVKYDFYGRLRGPGLPEPGAFRSSPQFRLEWELNDGRIIQKKDLAR